MTAPVPSLRDRIAAALLARIKQAVIHPGSTLPGGGTGHLLAANEYDLADAVLPLVTAENAAILRIVTDWFIEANEVSGVDAGDLAWRLEQAGCPLPDDDEDARADAEDGAR